MLRFTNASQTMLTVNINILTKLLWTQNFRALLNAKFDTH